MKNYDLKELTDFTSQVRRDIVRMVHAQNSGHPGGSLGCVEFFTAIYKVLMNHNTNFSMDWEISFGLIIKPTLFIEEVRQIK